MVIYIKLVYCITHFSNTNISSFSTYYSLGWLGYLSSFLHFSSICLWEFNIIIILNIISLALQISTIHWTNLYLIPKPSVLTRTNKLCDNRYLPQKCYFLLPLGLPNFINGLFHLFYSLYFLHPSTFSPRFLILCSSTLKTKKCKIMILVHL